MSNAIASGQDPDPVSFRTDPHGSGHPDLDTITDPLLQNGSYIDPSNNLPTSGQTTIKPNKDNQQAAPQSSSSANGVEAETPVKSRRKVPVTMAPGSAESASWLPPGWLVEDRVRTSGATAGTVDKYYIEPTTGRKFRSKREVQYYLETGTLKKRKKGAESSEADVNPPENSGSQNNKKAAKNAKGSIMKFDYLNVPDKIEWALTVANEDAWTPFTGGSKVPEYERQSWEFEMMHFHR
ncbi:hypothetical protein JCGZ_11043 [Jatropha curcas]|uniref:MBD domain-containing protein n=1 Tax=Jatropha curcas TaxID=180498 RepID=A0A067KHJ8_JATCU|nr:methyl-CpG-binding domain-containing protein 5 [Jatropha curcas]KDP34493.1 hypothetical protein JCGZ_11043 [Jatropha curcas]